VHGDPTLSGADGGLYRQLSLSGPAATADIHGRARARAAQGGSMGVDKLVTSTEIGGTATRTGRAIVLDDFGDS
jgi:hypothetical protein